MFYETTETVGKPQLVPSFPDLYDSSNLYPGYSYTRLKRGLEIQE